MKQKSKKSLMRIRKKIEKRASALLIQATIFEDWEWDNENLCFSFGDEYGAYFEMNAWNYLEELAEASTVEYVVVDWDSGKCKEVGRKQNLSVIESIKIFKENYL